MKKYEGINSLAKRLAKESNISIKEAETRVNDFVKIMNESLSDDTNDGIQFIGFLTLQKVVRKARLGRNPKTKETVQIPSKKGIKVFLGKMFDSRING